MRQRLKIFIFSISVVIFTVPQLGKPGIALCDEKKNNMKAK